MNKYSINVTWSDEDNAFLATIPEFPGLSAFADSKAGAIAEAEIALDGFIKIFEEDGCPLPEPEVLQKFSGQTRLRLPKTLHANLVRAAKDEGISLNQHIVYLLTERNMARGVDIKLDRIEKIAIGNWFQPYPEARAESSRFEYVDVESIENQCSTGKLIQ